MTPLEQQAVLRRRAFLTGSAGTLGALALAQLWGPEARAGQDAAAGAPARHVICLFQHGGPSQMDLFDPKPALTKWHGQPYPAGKLEVHFHQQQGNVLGSPFQFQRFGQCGMELSELLPCTGKMADALTLIRSMHTDSVDHESALRLIHSGKFLAGMPSWGSWVTYALGSENENLPAYVVLADPGGMPIDGEKNWTSAFLPAQHQGTVFRAGDPAVLNLKMPAGTPAAARQDQLELLGELNRRHLRRLGEIPELEARIAGFETAARMQTAVPEVLDLSGETAETRRLYGLDEAATREYGSRCLLARRLVERGVRFVQVFLAGQPWDTHSKNAEQLRGLTARTDRPSAALVEDLQRRGLLESTVVMWAGEFGRQPISQGTDGRDHNRHGFSLWLAGGGFRPGYVHGATDDFGYRAVQDAVSVHQLHATLLAALGLDHRRLTWPHEGRPASLTDVDVTQAEVVTGLFARPPRQAAPRGDA
jgi:hypothetical protein